MYGQSVAQPSMLSNASSQIQIGILHNHPTGLCKPGYTSIGNIVIAEHCIASEIGRGHISVCIHV